MLNNNLLQDERKEVFGKEDAYQVLEMMNSCIRDTDMKVSFTLAFVGVLVSSIFGEELPNAFQKIANELNICKVEAIDILAVMLVLLLYGVSFFAIIYFILAIIARVQVHNHSVCFFGSVSKMKLDEYKDKVKNISEKEMMEDLKEQIYINSCICSLKVSYYNKGIKCLVVSIGCWFICMIFQLI